MSDTTSDTVNAVKTSVYRILEEVGLGNKTTMRDLVDKVVAETGVKISIANGLVSMIIQEWVSNGGGTINAGRAGGIYPGGKKIRQDPRPRCESCHQVVRFIKHED